MERIFAGKQSCEDDDTTLRVRGIDGKLYPVFAISPELPLEHKPGWRNIAAVKKHVIGRARPMFFEIEE